MRFFFLDSFRGRLDYFVAENKEQKGSIPLADVLMVSYANVANNRQVREREREIKK